jgi:alpha-beta hydrolase superfamily lysophospholipase
MSKFEYNDYWFNYVLNSDPHEIKNIIKEEYITSDGLKIHMDIYDKEGPLDKTVIFIHGTSVYSRFYAEFLYNLFQKGFRIVAPDMIGHGLSEGKRGRKNS